MGNDLHETARFFNEYHTNRYLIINVSRELTYKSDGFFNRVLFMNLFQDYRKYPTVIPCLEDLYRLCEHIHANFRLADVAAKVFQTDLNRQPILFATGKQLVLQDKPSVVGLQSDNWATSEVVCAC